MRWVCRFILKIILQDCIDFFYDDKGGRMRIIRPSGKLIRIPANFHPNPSKAMPIKNKGRDVRP